MFVSVDVAVSLYGSPLMTRVKICGITNLDDALYAAESGADALGFVFYPNSPRYIEPEAAQAIIQRLPPCVTTVGVFVNEPAEQVNEIIRLTGIQIVQLHGDESPEDCATIERPVIKAFQVSEWFDVQHLSAYSVHAYLLDAYHPRQRGGTGHIFDWAIAREAKEYGRIILAGGLTPENVRQAIEVVRPYAVDVSSGVEWSPGVKDREKVKRFLARARASWIV